MKSLLQFVLVAVAACAIFIDAASLGRAQESSPSPPGTRREVLEVLRQRGALARKPRVLYVGPLRSESWIVGLKCTSENYSVNMVTIDCSGICHN